jgi:hypothetical protein
MRIRLSTIFPSTIRSITTPFTSTWLPVAGIPKNSPRWVPRQVKRLQSLSPSAASSSTVQRRSGKAAKNIARICFRPSRPCSCPGKGSSSTKFSATSSSKAARFFLNKTSSTKRRPNTLISSTDMYRPFLSRLARPVSMCAHDDIVFPLASPEARRQLP